MKDFDFLNMKFQTCMSFDMSCSMLLTQILENEEWNCGKLSQERGPDWITSVFLAPDFSYSDDILQKHKILLKWLKET